jgi:hypothetical protein
MVIFRTTLLTSVLLLCSTGVGGDIVPLGYGNRWECIDEATGAEEFTEITGTTSIWGREFWVLEHMEGGANEGLVNYLAIGSDGEFLIGGARFEDGCIGPGTSERGFSAVSCIVATPFRAGQCQPRRSDLRDSAMSSFGGHTPAMDGEVLTTARIQDQATLRSSMTGRCRLPST